MQLEKFPTMTTYLMRGVLRNFSRTWLVMLRTVALINSEKMAAGIKRFVPICVSECQRRKPETRLMAISLFTKGKGGKTYLSTKE